MDVALLTKLNAARAERRAVAVITDLASGRKQLMDTTPAGPLGEAVEARLKSGKSGIERIGEGETFVEVHVPSARLVVIGAVHISQALAPMARACNFDVTVIDPRTAFATEERFAGTDLRAEWPQDAIDGMLDPYTALVAVTHDPKIDDIPLTEALKAGSFYVGALGSRKTHAKRVDRLTEQGVSADALARIDAPIGLDIGAATPAEIAVAVLAQMIERLRKRETSAGRLDAAA